MSLFVPLDKTAQLPKRYVLSRGYSAAHMALDMVGVSGQKVLAAQAGRVFAASWEGDPPGPAGPWAFGGGNTVLLDHYGVGDRRAKTSYAHLTRSVVTPGQWVRRGQVIGYAGATGNADGAHLHFAAAEAHDNPDLYASFKWFDPRQYMRAHAYMNGSQEHGSRVNSPFFENTFTVNAGVNFREFPTTLSKNLGTTRVRHSTIYVASARGQEVYGTPVWYQIWHPWYGECFVHSRLGDLS